MASEALSIIRPEGVSVRLGSVSATGVDVVATNSCVMITFADKTQLNAFVSGLGAAFDYSGELTIRFFVGRR